MNVNGEGLAAMRQAQPAQSFRDVGQCRAARHGNQLCAILEPDQHIGWDKSVAGKMAHSFSSPFPWKTWNRRVAEVIP